MRYKTVVELGGALGVATTLLCGAGGVAGAQESGRSYLTQPLDAPDKAFELKVGTGYTQGFGNAAPGRGMPEVGGAGVGFSVDIDYRINPHWSVGVEAQYQELANEQNSSSRGLVANIGATYHFAPILRGDPWLRLGTGYRFLWDNDVFGDGVSSTQGESFVRHGFEIAAGQIGYDVRVSENTALAPVVGADLNVFGWQDPGGTLSSAQVATFIYAGVLGRFDIGGTTSASQAALTGANVPAETPPPPAQAAPPPAQTTPIAPSIAVSSDVLAQCKLNLDSIDKAPKFGFDQTELEPDDVAVLKQIGDCFASGPMKGQGLLLVGRADPRGTVAYNQDLGHKRAERVAEFLEGMGVDKSSGRA